MALSQIERRESLASDDLCNDAADISTVERVEDAIFTCKYPGCTRQYASTDGKQFGLVAGTHSPGHMQCARHRSRSRSRSAVGSIHACAFSAHGGRSGVRRARSCHCPGDSLRLPWECMHTRTCDYGRHTYRMRHIPLKCMRLSLPSPPGVRKHCRKSHPEWLREVDLEKAANGCRWAAYCTRETVSDGSSDLRTTPVGAKRAREQLPSLAGETAAAAAATGRATANEDARARPSHPLQTSHLSHLSQLDRIRSEFGAMGNGGASHPAARHVSINVRKAEYPSIGTAMDGKSALRPPAEKRAGLAAAAALQGAAARENMLPPEMVSVPNDLNSPLPSNTSSLTPNAQARARLGEIADGESSLLLGQGHLCPTSLPSPLCDASHPVPAPGFGFFVQWSMPPMKRGKSLADTRDAMKLQEGEQTDYGPESAEGGGLQHDSPSFLDSVLA